MPNKQQRQIGMLFIVLGIVYAVAAVCYAIDAKFIYSVINLAASVTSVLLGRKIRQRFVSD